MWTIGDPEPEQEQRPTRPDCPGCGEPDLAGDDFCHECGHAFTHFGAGSGDPFEDEANASPCPMCGTGEVVALDHGRSQCDSCGYMARDEG
jgi:hypothetical protein